MRLLVCPNQRLATSVSPLASTARCQRLAAFARIRPRQPCRCELFAPPSLGDASPAVRELKNVLQGGRNLRYID